MRVWELTLLPYTLSPSFRENRLLAWNAPSENRKTDQEINIDPVTWAMTGELDAKGVG